MCFKHLVYSLTVRVDVEQIFHDLSILPPCRLLELIWNELNILIKWYYFVFSHTLQSNKSYKCKMCFVLCCQKIIFGRDLFYYFSIRERGNTNSSFVSSVIWIRTYYLIFKTSLIKDRATSILMMWIILLVIRQIDWQGLLWKGKFYLNYLLKVLRLFIRAYLVALRRKN